MIQEILKSYSKINIGLRILGKRGDGYHDIETIFYPIKIFDELGFTITPAASEFNSVLLKSNKSYIPLNADNLCYKAVLNFFKTFRIKETYKIEIDMIKNIPVGGGLGGGSSNAATVLKFLIRYFKIDIEINRIKIIDLALSLGSDVPFFLILKPCYAEGRGEKLKPLKNFKINYNILIVNPHLHVSTKWAFENLNLPNGFRNEKSLDKITEFEPDKKNEFENDFEKIVFEKYPLLREIKNYMLDNGSVFSSMSGSGATVYGLFEPNKKGTLLKCREDFYKKKYLTFISNSE
ncbi:MAG TPA: 4-(cytidine 5'-diphospho)-2-C-methyl-D-erythritol kinase [Ignavibacteria bacterium]|nr:4-(cytidine 5'-diphospho)-2-C-methyl-D-erythritol kinase [Ignavibacteria bacterium]